MAGLSAHSLWDLGWLVLGWLHLPWWLGAAALLYGLRAVTWSHGLSFFLGSLVHAVTHGVLYVLGGRLS